MQIYRENGYIFIAFDGISYGYPSWRGWTVKGAYKNAFGRYRRDYINNDPYLWAFKTSFAEI